MDSVRKTMRCTATPPASGTTAPSPCEQRRKAIAEAYKHAAEAAWKAALAQQPAAPTEVEE